ncbi:MAG: aminotransferase class I/II-fold pyridoxal phosphate-dependent enzyme [Lachnospiraceae bacterium]|jgi:methionine-gamma-lyase|nr:aminotransferase class I/II-fold pyridoxal phosphate-dependent enzyme [Lachnospiraceae bacterium]
MTNDLSTKLLHTGDGQFAKKIAKTASVAETLPIYHSSVFAFDDIDAVDAIYQKEAQGYIYSRIAAPNADAVAEILAAADGGKAALVFASGMAAITTTILSFVGTGDHAIASNVLYGGVQDFFANELPRLGIEVTFLDLTTEDVAAHIRPNTKLVYTEIISNPLMAVPDVEALAKTAHERGVKLLVDNTFATPVIARPLALGADVVLYSATKYLGGHSDIVGGAAVGRTELVDIIRRYLVLYGGVLGPQDCWLLARSLRTLELRMRKHSENALAVARFLESHPQIEKVYYPGLESSPSHGLAKRQFGVGLFGGMLSVDLHGGESAADQLTRALDKITIVPSLAGTATTVSWAARTSHRFYKREDRLRVGISDGQLRFSVGLEAEKDIIAELSAALGAL